MTILVEDYKLIQKEVGFDLIQTIKSEETLIKETEGKRIRIKTGKLIDRDIDLGYNMDLESCIKKIIHNNLAGREVIVTLHDWLKLYREEREKITKLINI